MEKKNWKCQKCSSHQHWNMWQAIRIMSVTVKSLKVLEINRWESSNYIVKVFLFSSISFTYQPKLYIHIVKTKKKMVEKSETNCDDKQRNSSRVFNELLKQKANWMSILIRLTNGWMPSFILHSMLNLNFRWCSIWSRFRIDSHCNEQKEPITNIICQWYEVLLRAIVVIKIQWTLRRSMRISCCVFSANN